MTGPELLQQRIALGLSQRVLARRIERDRPYKEPHVQVSDRTISNWELEKYPIPEGMLPHIEVAFAAGGQIHKSGGGGGLTPVHFGKESKRKNH